MDFQIDRVAIVDRVGMEPVGYDELRRVEGGGTLSTLGKAAGKVIRVVSDAVDKVTDYVTGSDGFMAEPGDEPGGFGPTVLK